MVRVAAPTVVLLMSIAVAVAGQEIVIDDFEYASPEAAREAWVAKGNSASADLMDRDGGTALRISADFNDESSVSLIDRNVDLDLSRSGRFSLDLYIDTPGLIRDFVIYFRSGDGWYSNRFQALRPGWATVNFSRAEARTIGKPGGWDSIGVVRLRAYRGSGGTGVWAVDNLVGYRERCAIVRGTYTMAARRSMAPVTAEAVYGMLADAGLMTSVIGDEDVEAGALEDFECAIFPYNLDMSEAEVEAIKQYIEDGGHIMLFYAIPHSLRQVMGIEVRASTDREYERQFNEIRFEDADQFAGIPGSVMQDSPRVRIVEPVEGESRVIGWWYDSAGESTGYPALVASDSGTYISYILLRSDWHAKGKMLVAMLAHYLPEVWPTVTQEALEGPEQIGHIYGVEAVTNRIEEHMETSSAPAKCRTALDDHHELLGRARQLFQAEEYPQAVDTAEEAWDRLRDAYLLAQVPRRAEFRAWWEGAGTGPLPAWEASIQNLAENGFNAVVPNVVRGGAALYDSEYLPHSSIVAERGDLLAECVDAAARHGIEVHAMMDAWRNTGMVPEAFTRKLREEGRLQKNFAGEEIGWLCPSDPRNFELKLNAVLEVVRNYDVDGIQFDFIRYPDQQSCYCDGCHERFERDTGLTVENWPAGTREDEAIRDAWLQWRCDQISRLVEATAEQVREIDPQCNISAAVKRYYPSSRRQFGQDWAYWIKQGWLDFVCPMDYTNSDVTYADMVARQMTQVAGRAPLYPGIGAASSRSRLGTGRVAGQMQIGRNLGADGFIIFQYGLDQAQSITPELGQMLSGERAVHPHNAPRFAFELDDELTRRGTFGLHVEPGAIVTASVARMPDIEGRRYDDEVAHIVVQDVDGNPVWQLDDAPQLGDDPVTVRFPVERGLFRLAVVGEYEDRERGTQRFVTRSMPIVAGHIAEDVADLL